MPREDRDEQALTGLEAGIVFIAFVVVASVFAYAVLGAGMATSQKSQKVMHDAFEEAGSALRPGYSVIAKLDNGEGLLDFIEFDLETATDLAGVDMKSMTYAIVTKDALFTIPSGDPTVTLTWRQRRDADSLLEAGEIVTVKLGGLGRTGIGRGDTFTLAITAAEGATATLARTIPAGIGKNVYLELF
ncbi:flagellin [Methanoculleus sp. Wushi-C6]|uniref:Flagellin n=1 Tax=Methanoculleus caldifontis TaxID=2651577 RepID=A0ABU3X249_9EURY|nr:archaellin/type IV pilin N-terminal domain-containing protein [Methanoculleus sp. Wushi-C6]MDV2482111.1 flagellin [Methanoculleus sp. Wushi-C6]